MKQFTVLNPASLCTQYGARGRCNQLNLADADLRFDPDFLQPGEADTLFHELVGSVPWRQDTIRLYGKTHRIPRLHQWYGEPGTDYRWSGIEMRPLPWPGALDELRSKLETYTRGRFNCALVNLYRDGRDCMGWHSDDEIVLGNQPLIASISLGAERDLLLRRRSTAGRSHRINLGHGSLLIMAGATQRHWQHALPRRRRVQDPRINLTFRYIGNQDAACERPPVSRAGRRSQSAGR